MDSKKNFYSLIDYCNYHIKNSNEYNVIFTIFKHIKDEKFPTLEQLAEEAYISSASVLRLIHKIGFSSYDELKDSVIKAPPDIVKKLQIRMLTTGRTDLNSIIEGEYKSACENMKKTVEVIDKKKIEEVVDLIENCEYAILIGENFTLAMSRALQMDLIALGVATLMFDRHNFNLQKIRNSNNNTLVIYNLISLRFIDEETLGILKEYKKQGAKVILFLQDSSEEIDDFKEIFDIVFLYGDIIEPLSGHHSLLLLNRIIGNVLALRVLKRENQM